MAISTSKACWVLPGNGTGRFTLLYTKRYKSRVVLDVLNEYEFKSDNSESSSQSVLRVALCRTRFRPNRSCFTRSPLAYVRRTANQRRRETFPRVEVQP